MQLDGCLCAPVQSRSKRFLWNRAKNIFQLPHCESCKSPPRPGFNQCRGTR